MNDIINKRNLNALLTVFQTSYLIKAMIFIDVNIRFQISTITVCQEEYKKLFF